MEVGAVEQQQTLNYQLIGGSLKDLSTALRDMQKTQERLITKVPKIEARGNERSGGNSRPTSNRKGRWHEDGRPIFNFCDKAGHVYRECYQRKAAVTPEQTDTKNE